MRSFLSVKTIKAFTGEMTIGDGVISVACSVFPIQDVVSIIDGTAYIRVTCVLGEITQASVSNEGLPVYVLSTGVQVVAVDPSAHVVSQIHDTLLSELIEPVTVISEKPVSVSGQVTETKSAVKAEEQKPKAKRTRRPRKKVETVKPPVEVKEEAKPTEEPILEVEEETKEIPSTFTALGAGVVAAAVAQTTLAEAKEPVEDDAPTEIVETAETFQSPEDSFSLEPTDEDAGIDDELPAPVEDSEVIAKAEAAVAKAEAEEDDSLDLPIAEDDRSDFEPLDGFDTLDKVDTSYNATETDLFENGLPEDDSVDPNDALAPAHRADDAESEEEPLEVEDEDLVEDRYEVDDDDDLYNFDEEDN